MEVGTHILDVEEHMTLAPAATTVIESPLEVRPTRFGKGVFARKEFLPGEKILQFRGRIYSKKEYLSKVNPEKCHYMQIDSEVFLGPTTSPDNFVNHCCEPNAGLKVVNGKAFLVAINSIHVDQEITFDYSTSMAEDHWEMDCACGVPACRSRVRDFKYIPKEVQTRYLQLGIVPDFVIRSAGMRNPYDLFSSVEIETKPVAKKARKARIAHGMPTPSLEHAQPAY